MAVYLAWINFGLNCLILVLQVLNLRLILKNGRILRNKTLIAIPLFLLLMGCEKDKPTPPQAPVNHCPVQQDTLQILH